MENPLVIDQAFIITKYITTHTMRAIKFKDALYLAGFSFPLETKLRLIDSVIGMGRAETIYSALYFRIAFHEAETQFHKGPKPPEDSLPASVGEILAGVRFP